MRGTTFQWCPPVRPLQTQPPLSMKPLKISRRKHKFNLIGSIETVVQTVTQAHRKDLQRRLPPPRRRPPTPPRLLPLLTWYRRGHFHAVGAFGALGRVGVRSQGPWRYGREKTEFCICILLLSEMEDVSHQSSSSSADSSDAPSSSSSCEEASPRALSTCLLLLLLLLWPHRHVGGGWRLLRGMLLDSPRPRAPCVDAPVANTGPVLVRG